MYVVVSGQVVLTSDEQVYQSLIDTSNDQQMFAKPDDD